MNVAELETSLIRIALYAKEQEPKISQFVVKMSLENLSEEQKYQEITEKILKDKTHNPDKYVLYNIIILKDEIYAKTKFFKISATEKILDGKIVINIEIPKNMTEDNDFLKTFEIGLLKAVEKK